MGKISVYNLGTMGVNVDKSPIHLDDGELTQAQNAIHDVAGLEGGVRKRPGLARFNSTAGAGTVLGGIGVPLTLKTNLAGALAAGPSRKQFWGRRSKSATMGTTQGWWTSVDGWTTVVEVLSSTPSNPRSDTIPAGLLGSTFNTMNGMPSSCAVVRNKLYYPASSYTIGTDPIPIWVYDGTEDKKFIDIPKNTGAAYGTVMSMLVVGDNLYVTVYDDDNAVGAIRGRVFAVDISSGALTLQGAAFSAEIPYCMAWFQGRLWVGTINNTSSAGTIYSILPGIETAWTLERTMASSGSIGCSMLCAYNGQLFAGSRCSGSGTNQVEVRSTTGTWSASDTVAAITPTITGAVSFNNKLLVVWVDTSLSASRVRAYNGASWSTPLASAANVVLDTIWVDNGVVYVGGGGENQVNKLYSSTDGTTFTDISSQVPSASTIVGSAMTGTLVL